MKRLHAANPREIVCHAGFRLNYKLTQDRQNHDENLEDDINHVSDESLTAILGPNPRPREPSALQISVIFTHA
jgi:hypothetical protein